jgi:hypothetical protein
MGVEENSWLILGTPFRCLGAPPGPLSELAALLRGFPTPGPAAGRVDLRVEAGGPPFALVEDGGERWEVPPGGAPLSSHLEYRLIDGAIRRARDRWVLHAGAVVAGDGTCLIIGESGAGKTSLTLWLWASGLPLVTDDLCPVDRASLLPQVFPRALHMDAEYSPRLLARIPPRPAGYPADYYPFPGDAKISPAPPVTRLLVLERGPRPEGEVEPLGQSEAAHHLLAAVIKNPDFEFGAALTGMLGLAAGCRAYRLRSSTPEGAGERALAILGS